MDATFSSCYMLLVTSLRSARFLGNRPPAGARGGGGGVTV